MAVLFVLGLVGAGIWVAPRYWERHRFRQWLREMRYEIVMGTGERSAWDRLLQRRRPLPDYDEWLARGREMPGLTPWLRSTLEQRRPVDDAVKAAHALSAMRDEASVPLLLVALRAPEAELRRAAAIGLWVFPQEHVVEALSVALREDDDPVVRASAAQALALMETPAADGALADGLDGQSEMVRWVAQQAVNRRGDSDGQGSAGP